MREGNGKSEEWSCSLLPLRCDGWCSFRGPFLHLGSVCSVFMMSRRWHLHLVALLGSSCLSWKYRCLSHVSLCFPHPNAPFSLLLTVDAVRELLFATAVWKKHGRLPRYILCEGERTEQTRYSIPFNWKLISHYILYLVL